MNKFVLAISALGATAALSLAPAVAFAAPTTPAPTNSESATTTLGAISNVTATPYQHPKYGKVYKISGNVTGASAGQMVQLLNANGTPAKGFTPYAFGGGSSFVFYYNPGSAAGNYMVKIGNQTSAQFRLAPLATGLGLVAPTGGM